ncbi:mitotic-spindle organizing protein 2A [Trichonephila clavipes]|nr:mitotic-spindle organizing protein 2A [Trichonephila clavipes]
MRLQERKGTVDGYEWHCRNQSKDNRHDVVRSVRKGTWFSESKLAITIILRLTRYWFGKSMNAFVVNDLKVNKNTVVDWYMFCRERESKKCFFRVVESRTKEELLKGYVHLRVNHSLTFVDPETGAHTNSIEGTWSAIKKGLHKAHVKGQFDSYLAEYMWRRSNGHELVDENFHKFLASIARVYPPTDHDEMQA